MLQALQCIIYCTYFTIFSLNIVGLLSKYKKINKYLSVESLSLYFQVLKLIINNVIR